MSKIQCRLVVTPKIIPSLSTCKNHSINLLNSSNQFVRYIWFKSPMIYKASLIFDHHRPKIIKITFSFPGFLSTHIISLFNWFLLEIQPILEFWDQSSHNHFWLRPANIFQSTFNYHESVSTGKRSGFSIILF